jgi:short subunit dehydrogenase-like uncharacterized protein
MPRTHDVVLFGATGFTGRLVAEYLAAQAPPDARLALAGRDRAKLEAVRAALPAAARAWPLLQVDASDEAAVARLAESTRVVCTTVGPYARNGHPLVAACAKAGTHCCDLTGEVQFMRDVIDRHHATAQASGARIVHACGFDSIPSDLGVLVLHEALGALKRATYVVEVAKGGFSGGTVASMLNLLDEARADRSRRRLLVDPYALSPDRAAEPSLGDERDQAGVRFDRFVARWTAPFFMAAVNTRVVRRSNALLGHAYGRAFRYAEVMGFRAGPGGAFKATVAAAAQGALMAALLSPPLRKAVERRLPKPGEGPDEATRRAGFLRVRIVGEAEDGRRLSVRVEGKGDPGYQLTALMLAESALCLALDEGALPKVSGVLTPATAMGRVLVNRLVRAGMTFAVEG